MGIAITLADAVWRLIASPFPTSMRQQITGDPLFLSSYVAFNRDKDAVGFAARK
jgi:hypothetical protein